MIFTPVVREPAHNNGWGPLPEMLKPPFPIDLIALITLDKYCKCSFLFCNWILASSVRVGTFRCKRCSHEDIQWERTYCSTYSSPRHQVAIVNFSPRTLYPRKECWCPLSRKLGGPQTLSGRCWSRENLFLGVQPRTVQPVAIRFPDYAIPATRSHDRR
jgi:hypothetical protein